jgi:hypothetical protein
MTPMAKHPKRPRDPNQLAKSVADLATTDDAEWEAAKLKAGVKPLKPKEKS